MIAVEAMGSSLLGEVWYAEADTPLGPWVYARKVVTHDDYSFYNPKHHAMFDQEGGRIIYFEGTYTTTFSGSKDPTPRYDYNQIMYQLDLSDPRLALPVPIYVVHEQDSAVRHRCCERADRGNTRRGKSHSLPRIDPDWRLFRFSRSETQRTGRWFLTTNSAGQGTRSKVERWGSPVFYVVPADVRKPHAGSVELFESGQTAESMTPCIQRSRIPGPV